MISPFGRRFRELTAGEKQEDVAARLGVSQSSVSRMANGVPPSERVLARISEAYGVPQEELDALVRQSAQQPSGDPGHSRHGAAYFDARVGDFLRLAAAVPGGPSWQERLNALPPLTREQLDLMSPAEVEAAVADAQRRLLAVLNEWEAVPGGSRAEWVGSAEFRDRIRTVLTPERLQIVSRDTGISLEQLERVAQGWIPPPKTLKRILAALGLREAEEDQILAAARQFDARLTLCARLARLAEHYGVSPTQVTSDYFDDEVSTPAQVADVLAFAEREIVRRLATTGGGSAAATRFYRAAARYIAEANHRALVRQYGWDGVPRYPVPARARLLTMSRDEVEAAVAGLRRAIDYWLEGRLDPSSAEERTARRHEEELVAALHLQATSVPPALSDTELQDQEQARDQLREWGAFRERGIDYFLRKYGEMALELGAKGRDVPLPSFEGDPDRLTHVEADALLRTLREEAHAEQDPSLNNDTLYEFEEPTQQEMEREAQRLLRHEPGVRGDGPPPPQVAVRNAARNAARRATPEQQNQSSSGPGPARPADRA